jgi:hypothetical protein
LNAYLSDTSVPKERTKRDLRQVIKDVELMLESLDESDEE